MTDPLPPSQNHFGLGYVQRGDAALAQGDHRQAAADFCRAVALDAADAGVYARMAGAFAAIGDRTQALKALDAAIHLAPEDVDLRARAGALAIEAGWPNRARRYWEALVALPGQEAVAAAGLERVAAAIAGTGLEGIDPPGAPPEEVALKGFTPPARPTPAGGAPEARPPGRRLPGAPPSIGEVKDLKATAPPPAKRGHLAKDGFGTTSQAADYLAAFREPPPTE